MKTRILVLLKLLGTAFAVMSQGTVYFSNYVPSQGVDAPIYIDLGENACARVEGSGLVAQLYAGPASTGSLGPVGMPVPFLTGALAGYFDGGSDPLRAVPNVLAGFPALAEVRVWRLADGATWEAAFANAPVVSPGRSNPFLIRAGDVSAPGYMTGLGSFQFGALALCVPEPSTLALLLLGALVLAARLRRR